MSWRAAFTSMRWRKWDTWRRYCRRFTGATPWTTRSESPGRRAEAPTTFWSQAAQQGFRPKVVTIGKAFLFPAPVAALGDRADGLSCEVAWSPLFPFKSGLTGQTGQQLVDEYRKASGRDAPFVLGMFHALLEVAMDVLKR